MSEPDSGSDLAGTRTRATKVQGGYLVNGTKVWTSGAHQADYMILFCRTGQGSPDMASRHEGTSQFLVNLRTTQGIQIRPIHALTGEHHFNEAVFTDTFLPDSALLGKEGDGWNQVTSELAYERSGPERFLSSFLILTEMMRRLGPDPSERAAMAIGRLVAHIHTLRRMSRSVRRHAPGGREPGIAGRPGQGTRQLVGTGDPRDRPPARRSRALAGDRRPLPRHPFPITLHAPSFSLRGGTREIMRGMIARGLGLR